VQVDPVQAALGISLLALVFTTLGALIQARATKLAAQWTIDAQREIAHDALLRQRRQEQLGDFTSQARACIALYLSALATAEGNVLGNPKALSARLDQLEALTLVPPLKIDDDRLGEVVRDFVHLELAERATVLEARKSIGTQSRPPRRELVKKSAQALEQAYNTLESAADAYIIGARPTARSGWLSWFGRS
jgi:hypothetical protein